MNTVTDIASLWLSQNARLITLDCARQPALVAPFVVEQMTGREGINALFCFDADVVASTADCDIDACIGAALTLGLLQPDGTHRYWHGLCTSASALGTDGGLARYRLRIEPALAQLRWRRDSHVFQDADARAIIIELLAAYPDGDCTFDVTQTLAPRPICTQYRETDFAFFCRLLAAEGLNWRFEHDLDAHRLVIFDAQATLPGDDVLRFHGVRSTDVDDAIDTWLACRTVQPNGVALSRWDSAQLVAPAAEHRSQLDAGDLPAMSLYDGSGERIASDQTDAHGQLMLQAAERANKVFMGAGAVRRLAAGHGFTLAQHDHYPDGENGFKVLWVEHVARNNLRTGIQDADARNDGATYRNRFACVRNTVALVPAETAAAHPRTALGTQTALVVGLPDAVATTNRDHQVRIQFAWQRGARPNPGGLDHPGGGNAPGNATCGTWVRVAEALAGPNWGSQFIPRIGTEVIVDFIEGNIDRPVVVGQLHNGVAPPPFSDEALSGIQTASFDGQGGNQWQLDDTQDQLRMRLASSSAGSALHLGHLVHQGAGSVRRGATRGSGFELRTDAWTVLRGAQGVFLSTTARPAAGTGVTSTQMDAQEAVALLKGAQSLDDALVQAAVQQQALISQPASHAQTALISALDPQAKGKYEGPVNGQNAAKAQPGDRAIDATQPVERFGVPAVVLDAAATLNWATPASAVVTASQHLHWTTQSDVHLAAGTTVSTVAGHAASLFTHSGGLRAIAANGPVSLQAHTDQLAITADKEVIVVSVSDAISIQAKAKIVLHAGQSSVTLEGGDITFACPGNFTVKGGQHVFDGGSRLTQVSPKLPDSRLQLFDQAFVLIDRKTGVPAPRQPYRLILTDGTSEEGLTDQNGQTHVITSASPERVAIALLSDKRHATTERPSQKRPGDAPKFTVADEAITTPVDDQHRHQVVTDAAACWTDDYEAEVEATARKYYATIDADGEELEFSVKIRYRLYLPVKENRPILVEVRFKIDLEFFNDQDRINEEKLSISEKMSRRISRDEKIKTMKANAERGIRLGWNNKFMLETVDPLCGKISQPIIYEIKWVESDQHFTMQVFDETKEIRANVKRSTMNVMLDTNSWTFAHEFAHCIGLPDEYSTSQKDDRVVKYCKPDGSMDVPLTAKRDSEEKSESEQTILSTYNNIVVHSRHAWNIAIEAQQLFRENIKREIKCNIVPV